jgi:alkanesulfonate monooxygenase SsuD/methylene tetrahydromethanopterin reductase-like flavin-dependent oxidoreductase (luciferase family)
MRPTTLPAWLGTVLPMRWGLSISLSEELADPSVIADVAVTAEANGWDGIFVWDHLWNHTREPFADPWITLAAVAVATERVVVGTMVTPLPRHRVQLVAQAATTLDRLAGGRVVLALGLGVDSYGEYSLFDEPAADDKARGAALDAGIDVLVPMLEGGPVPQLGGRVTTAAGARAPRVPIWVAGVTRYTAGPRRVARHGLDGLALVGDDEWAPATVGSALAAGGLAPGSLDVALVGGTHPDPAALEAAGATWCIPEILPGASAADALSRAATPP